MHSMIFYSSFDVAWATLWILSCICIEGGSAQLGYWTWVSGSNIPNQPGVGNPGAHTPNDTPSLKERAMYWNDDEFLWIWGGSSFVTLYSNQLWKFNLASREWYFVRNAGSSAWYGEKVISF